MSNNSKHQQANTTNLRAKSLRRALLSGSALSGGIVALMLAAAPQSAEAACFTSQATAGISPEFVICNFGTATTNTNHAGAAGDNALVLTDRTYTYDLPLTGQLLTQTAITGFGIEFRSSGYGSPVTVTVAPGATITQTGVPSFVGETNTAALALTAPAPGGFGAGSDLQLLGTGFTVTGTATTSGVGLVTTGTGAITVGTSVQPITGSSFTGQIGLATAAVSGATNIFLNNTTVTTNNADFDAIRAASTSGAINMTLVGGSLVQGGGALADPFGIKAATTSGGVNINSSARIGSGVGTDAFAVGIAVDNAALGLGGPTTGSVTVVQNGSVFVQNTAAQAARGIIVNSTKNQTITLGGAATINVNDASAAGTSVGIDSLGGAAGSTQAITVNGNITGADIGVRVVTLGDATVRLGGSIATTVGGTAVAVTSNGAGAINVTTDVGSNTTNATGVGINAVQSATGTGSITVVTNGAIDPPIIGVNMQILNAANASSIAYTNGINGNISATGTGVNAETLGAGNIVVVNDGVIGGTNVTAGINASATSGSVTVLSNGSVSSQGDAINVATFSGNINVTTGAGTIAGTTVDSLGGAIVANSTSGNIAIATGAGAISGNDAQAGANLGVIHAQTGGAGTIGVTLGTGGLTQTGTNPFNGIETRAVNGQTTIVTNGTINASTGLRAILGVASGTGGISVTTNAAATSNGGAGIGAIETSATTGATVISVNANVTNTNAAGDGIRASSTTGDIGVTTAAGTTVTGGNNAIIMTATGAGNLTANINGNLLGAPGLTMASGGGNVIVNVLGTVTDAGGTAISATTNGATAGSVLVASGISTSGASGINAQVLNAGSTGNVTVDSTRGPVTAAAGTGINATNAGTGFVAVSTGAVTGTGAGNNGVTAASTGGGAVNVFAFGPVAGGTGASNGISATSTGGNGSVLVDARGTVNGGTGINATGAGTGTVTVSALNTVTGTTANGVNATSGSGAIAVTTAAVTGATNGINAASTSGSVAVTTNGNITGGTAAGINAGGGTTGNVAVQTQATSNVSGNTGIIAAATGAGNVVIFTNGTVTGTGTTANGTSGDGIHVTAVNGNVQVDTFGTVTANTTTAGADAIDVNVTGSGKVVVNTFAAVSGDPGIVIATTTGDINLNPNAAVTGAANGIQTTTTSGNTSIVTGTAAPVTGGTNGIVSTTGTGAISIFANTDVTGSNGNGIQTTSAGAAATEIRVLGSGTVVTGTGTGNGGINLTANGASTNTISVAGGTQVRDNTGNGVRINTGAVANTATATLSVSGLVSGQGNNIGNAAVLIAQNNAGGPIAINVNPGNNNNLGVITNLAGSGGWAITANTANTQAINITNGGLVTGRVITGGGNDSFVNQANAIWNVSNTAGGANQFGAGNDTLNNQLLGTVNATNTDFNFGAGGTDTFTNAGTFNSNGTVNFLELETVNNNALNGNSNGIFNVGSVAGVVGEQTNFSSGAAATTAGGVQTVTNSGAFNILAVQSQVGAYRGSLNFFGANGSSFANNGGLINMQADGGRTTNAVTLNTVSLAGTSDLNYTYTWNALATNAYNYSGTTTNGQNARLAVDTFLGGPGSTSDRLVVGGNVSGTTAVKVNDTNAGPGALNTTGITVAAVQGAGSTNFQVDPTTTNFVNFGPLGAINKGAFIYPLLYVPGGAVSGNAQPNGNTYAFFGVPGPFLTQLPIAHTGAQNIFKETADVWEDRQTETLNCMRRGMIAAGQASGSGADLSMPVKAAPLPAMPDCNVGIWTKLIGSYNRTRNNFDFGNQFGPQFTGLNFDNSYRQGTVATISGIDFGRSELTSPFDSIVFSVMGGYITSFLDFNSSNNLVGPSTNTSFKYTGGTVGLSGTYMNRGFFVDGLVKADFLTLNIGGIPGAICGTNTLTCSQDVKSTTWGIVGNVGYRIERGRYFFEPIASVSYNRNRIADLNLPGAAITVQFGTVGNLDVGGGFRSGGVIMDDKVHYLEASLITKVWDRVFNDNPINVVNLGPTFQLTDNFKKVYGETGVQFDWINRHSGWSAFAKADAKFNQQFQTYTGKLGARYAF